MAEAGDDAIDRGISEFGAALASYVEASDTCLGAVLTDDDGYPIDYARRRAGISALDVQILGAQVERALAPIRKIARDRGVGRPTLTVACAGGILLTTPLAGETTLVALHRAEVDDDALSDLEADFAALAERILGLVLA